MLRKCLALVLTAGLLTMSNVAHAVTNGPNNDFNGDKRPEALLYKNDGATQWNEAKVNGYRTVGIFISSIDPHWNNQPNGIERIRILPYSEGAAYAMKAAGLNVSPYLIWPGRAFSAFWLLDGGAKIDKVAPSISGNISIPWANMGLKILMDPNPYGTWFEILADFVSVFIQEKGSSAIQYYGQYPDAYGYNNSYYNYLDWARYGSPEDMPYDKPASVAYQEQYNDVGFVHEYWYTEYSWNPGERRACQGAAQIEYYYFDTMNDQLSTWQSPIVYKGYWCYGF